MFQSGECEGIKCGYHAVIGLLALGAAGYNVIALSRRGGLSTVGNSHLLVNSLLYAAIVALEARKVAQHMGTE